MFKSNQFKFISKFLYNLDRKLNNKEREGIFFLFNTLSNQGVQRRGPTSLMLLCGSFRLTRTGVIVNDTSLVRNTELVIVVSCYKK